MTSLQNFVSEFLTFLEQRESHLLSWGFYNVSFGSEDIDNLLDDSPKDLKDQWYQLQEEEGWELEDLLDEMEHNGLLYRVKAGEHIYRSRFAEGVRLIADLKQMFKPQDWSTGPNLVSDIKMHLAPRRYPRREHPADVCWREDLEQFCWQKELQKGVFDALSKEIDGISFKFANFQRQSFRHILSNYRTRNASGSVVSAGTGSGKTKAFYIPAFLGLATELEPQRSRFTKIITIYPRNVLLADQLREAISEANKLNEVIADFGLRPISFGALLGTTPRNYWFEKRNGKYPAEKYDWKRVGSGFTVPFLKSPKSPDQDLVWRDEDRERGSTALYRLGGDGRKPDIPDGVLTLIRGELQKNPPDILFLSLEMLNREMGNPDWAKTFGIDQGDFAPRLLLLDEVHAYEGVSGAQAAWALRRWRHWSKTRHIHVVGLSATLKEAVEHLSRVADIRPSGIQEFTPSEEELEFRDVEYNLAIKGDPASSTSLLSTSIQTGMLLTRLLTPRNIPLSNDEESIYGAKYYGRKVFAFTDNLDSLNRWHSDMYDAERKRLAKLRLHPQHRRPAVNINPATVSSMNNEGQIWDLPRRLGHNLNQSLKVSRCSSQDPGANAGSDLIVASASLEVGFDDPEVGATLHHKKPMSMSSFIQRKGRAGRRIGTRPWTVVVLSDYGADRWAFQNAERLFQPEIDSIYLPLSNPSVLRIQAVYFLIDWLGRQINRKGPFSYLSRPSDFDRYSQQRAKDILQELLELKSLWKKFRNEFVRFFGSSYGSYEKELSEADLDAILWRSPRPVLRQAIPELLRKLEKGWRFADPQKKDDIEDERVNHPLPKYIPGATFSELGGVGVRLTFDEENKEDEYLSVWRALSEVCPGRVSKRYSLRVNEPGYWLATSALLLQKKNEHRISVENLFSSYLAVDTINDINVFQPLVFDLSHKPDEILDTSHASWNWKSRLKDMANGFSLNIFGTSPWNLLIETNVVHLHRNHTYIDVVRYAYSFDFDILLKTGTRIRGVKELSSSKKSKEAIGFRVKADGIVLRLNREELINKKDEDKSRLARFRPDYYLEKMKNCSILTKKMNSFLIGWMWQTSLSMLTATALKNRCSLHEAQQKLKKTRVAAAQKVMDHIFQTIEVIGTDDEERETKLKARLMEQWTDREVVQCIENLEKLLWEKTDNDYLEWVRKRYVATIAQAFKLAALNQVEEVADGDLVTDVCWTDEDKAEIYLTEMRSGGLGQIELIVEQLHNSPEDFMEALRHNFSFCPRDLMTQNILNTLNFVVGKDPESESIKTAFENVRRAQGFQAMENARIDLQDELSSQGLNASRGVIVGLMTKLLRPGSSTNTDRFIYLLNKAWRRAETRLGIAIDPRVFAYASVQYPPLRRRLAKILCSVSGGEEPSTAQIYAALQQFLFSDCLDSCPECLDSRNYYIDAGKPSRSLAVDWLGFEISQVNVSDYPDTWHDIVRQILLKENRVKVAIPSSQLVEGTKIIQGFLAEELEAGALLLPVKITGISRNRQNWTITLKLPGGSSNV